MFKVIVGLVTSERLAICACIVYGVLVLWILLSLICGAQVRFSRNCKNISAFIDQKGLTSDTYPKFIELATKLPDSFLRSWKTFEHANKGLPSEFIKRSECLELEFDGGLFNHNRSVMKGYIGFFTAFITILCFALTGSKNIVSGTVLAESLVLPFTFCLICMLTYFLYAALKQYQYKLCVENFNELVDILNEKVESGEIDFNTEVIASTSFKDSVIDPAINMVNENISNENKHLEDMAQNEELPFEEEYIESYVDQSNTILSKEKLDDFVVDDHSPVVEDISVQMLEIQNETGMKQQNSADTIEKENDKVYNDLREGEDNMEELKPEVKRGRGRPRKEKTPEGELVIHNDKEFEEALVRAEKLMKKNDEPLSQSQQKRVEKALKELVDAMKKYKEEN